MLYDAVESQQTEPVTCYNCAYQRSESPPPKECECCKTPSWMQYITDFFEIVDTSTPKTCQSRPPGALTPDVMVEQVDVLTIADFGTTG